MICKFEAGNTYRTRDGREAQVYAIYTTGSHPIHGAVFADDEWHIIAWTWRGFASRNERPESYDLIPPKHKVWVSLYRRRSDGRLDCRIVNEAERERELRTNDPAIDRIELLGPVEVEGTS